MACSGVAHVADPEGDERPVEEAGPHREVLAVALRESRAAGVAPARELPRSADQHGVREVDAEARVARGRGRAPR